LGASYHAGVAVSALQILATNSVVGVPDANAFRTPSVASVSMFSTNLGQVNVTTKRDGAEFQEQRRYLAQAMVTAQTAPPDWQGRNMLSLLYGSSRN